MSDKFTQADADRINNIVRDILGITMKCRLELVDEIDKEGTLATCEPQVRRNRYAIKLSNPDKRIGGNEEPNVLNDLIHENLHQLTFFMCPNIRELHPVELELYEQFIDHMAGVIERLYLRQK